MTDSPKPKQKALCVATRCANVEQFIATFHRFCDDSTFFVATLATRPVGLETAFSIQLDDKTPVLRGLCTVVEAWSTPANRFGRPGVRLSVKRLTNESIGVFRQLQTARKAAEAAEAAGEQPAPTPSGQISVVDTTPPLTVPIAQAVIPSSPDTAAAFATLKITALAPRPPAVAKTSEIKTILDAKPAAEAKPAEAAKPAEIKPAAAAKPEAASRAPASPPKLPPLRPIPSATPPAFPVFPTPSGAAAPLPSVRADATPPPTPPRTTTHGDATPTPSKPAATTPTPPAPVAVIAPTPVAPTPVVRTDSAPPLADSPPPRDYVPEPISASDDLTNPVASETRTPGSSFVLPANPLMNLTDKSLEGFIDCALYEETGNFFRAPEYENSLVDIDDVLASPPQPVRPAPRTLAPVSVLRPNAFLPAEPQHDFAPEPTPLPLLAGIVPQRAETEPPIPPTPRGGRAPTPPVYDESAGMFYGHQPHGSDDETGVGVRPPPTQPPPNMAMEPAPTYARQTPMPPLDSTAALIAVNQKRQRKRWLVIGASAAGTSLLLLVIVLATSGGGGNKNAAAATPAVETTPEKTVAKPPDKSIETKPVETKPVETKPVETKPVEAKPLETKAVTPPVDDPVEEPTGDPNAPPLVGSGPCKVTVNSSPAGSMVSIDDQQFGPSPITIAGPCAKRKIDVKHPRYMLGTKWVSLAAGKVVNVDLALSRPTYSVTVTSSPSGATVSIAGRRAGTTPTAVKVMGFTGVTLTVEKKGFRTETQKLYSKTDGERLSIKLVKAK